MNNKLLCYSLQKENKNLANTYLIIQIIMNRYHPNL
jgi:hypothetical protein